MQSHGQDRVRFAGGRAILHSPFSKGWTPRVPKRGTHSEHPGTAVMWDGDCFEVIAVEPSASGGVRYILSPWLDEQVIRVLDHYDEESESRRLAEHKARMRQQKQSATASISAMLLGHLPACVQNRLGNELGVSPSRMTIASCLLPLVLFGVCVFLTVGARMEDRPSPVPLWLMFLSACLLVESGIRFHIAMSQSRGVGSAGGFLLYLVYWLTILGRNPGWSPFVVERGSGMFTLPPSEDVGRRDAIEWRGPLLSLLSPQEQTMLEQRYGFDYRQHAYGLTWSILVFSSAGAVTSLVKILDGVTFTSALSFVLAGLLAVEQIRRLRILPRGPAGSVAAALVRPFVRRFLTSVSD